MQRTVGLVIVEFQQ